MPEHAEVRVAAAQLSAVVAGRTVESLQFSHPRTTRHALDNQFERFGRRRLTSVSARGKWLLVAAEGTASLLGIHLRMSGQLLAATPGAVHPDRHVHAVLALSARSTTASVAGGIPSAPDGGAGVGTQPVEVWFRDPRTFGEWRVIDDPSVLGAPDLFDPAVDAERACAAAARRTIATKAFLLDQRVFVAGVGSYLADETLHAVGIDPRRSASDLSANEWAAVLAAARSIADASAQAGGVTLKDEGWVDLWGRPGKFADELAVHARVTCRACGADTVAEVLSGRRARWCPDCQRPD